MSTFWVIFFFIVNIAMGTLLAIACNFVGKWSRKLASTDKELEKSEAESKISTWLWTACATIIVVVTVAFTEMAIGANKEIEKVNSRIETLERQITVPSIDTVYIKDVLKDE